MTDTHYVKLTGTRFELKEPLSSSAHQVFQGSGELVSTTTIDNKDGTFDHVYIVRPKILDLREAENESVVPVEKIKRHLSSTITMSQEMRLEIEGMWRDLGEPGDRETFYRGYMNKLITKIQAEREIAKGGV